MKRPHWLSSAWLATWLWLVACGISSRLPAEDQVAPPVAQATADAERPPEPAEGDDELFRLMELFADSLDQIDRNYVKDIDRRKLMEAAIRGMMSELDPYSSYISPAELDRFRSGVESEFGGIGIQVSIENGELRVISPIVGSPAYRAGLIAGDRILEIEGRSTAGITLDEAIQRMKGPLGTKVNVKFIHVGAAAAETAALDREMVRVETVLGDRRHDDHSWDWMFDEEKKIGYIRITGFGRHTTAELTAALQKLKEMKMAGLILDLRFNPGGLLSSAIEICDLFIANGRIVSTDGRNSPIRVWEAREPDTFDGFPMAVLVNKYSASASEILAACLQDHGRAVIIGERTWGKGSVQNIVELEEGKSALKLTTAGYKRPNGKNIHRYPDAKDSDDWGVLPNDGFAVAVSTADMSRLVAIRRERDIVRKPADNAAEPPSAAGFTDTQFAKALAYLKEKLSPADPEAPPEPVIADNPRRSNE